MVPISTWEDLFQGSWAANTATALTYSKSMDSQYHYDLAYYIDGNIAMFRASGGDTQYLDAALLLTENLIDNAILSENLGPDSWLDEYLGWTSERVDVAGEEVPLFESYCWRYVTLMLRVMRETPAVYQRTSYRLRYDRILEFTERNIFDKWYNRNANGYVYRSNTHMASHWAFISMNLAFCTRDMDRRRTYFRVFNNINHDLPNSTSSLRGQLAVHPSNAAAYFFNDSFGSFGTPGSDVAHANGFMAYLVEAHQVGLEWTDADMLKFRILFDSIIWPSGTTYRQYVDGTGVGTGWFNDGLCKLGRYSQTLQERLEAHAVGPNIQLYGNCALNVLYLNGGSGL